MEGVLPMSEVLYKEISMATEKLKRVLELIALSKKCLSFLVRIDNRMSGRRNGRSIGLDFDFFGGLETRDITLLVDRLESQSQKLVY